VNLQESVSGIGAVTVPDGNPELLFALRLAAEAAEDILLFFGTAKATRRGTGLK